MSQWKENKNKIYTSEFSLDVSINKYVSKFKHNDRECHKNADKNAAFIITLFLIQPVSSALQYDISLGAVIKSSGYDLSDDNSSLSWKMSLWMFNKSRQVKNDMCDTKKAGLSLQENIEAKS